MDPESALALTGNDAMRPIAAQVAARLRRVMEHVATGPLPGAARRPAGNTVSRE